VSAEAIRGGFVIPLPYGTQVDWLRNVLAAGHATLDVRGTTVAVDEPVVLPSNQVLPLLPSTRAAFWRMMPTISFLQVRTTPEPTPSKRPVRRRPAASGATRSPRTTPRAGTPPRNGSTPDT
jgi:hypothetical protein